MDILNNKKEGIKVSIDDDKIFEFVRKLPKDTQVELISHLLSYDDNYILKTLAKTEYNKCVKEYKSFVRISQDKIICKELNSDNFNQGLSDSYLRVAEKYKLKGDIWKQFENLPE